ncbi:MAG: methyltransferase domain-containing protein [Pseudomonadota bacterium]|nr:methyltransferase domain-containing protein [Pseudomonadota bacterium]
MQYSKAFTDALQFVWGEGFLSPGGPAEVEALLQGEDIAGSRALDIGSGVGGVDALLVTRHGAGEVVGIDVEPWLVEDASRRIAAMGLAHRVRFLAVEPGPLPFPDADFDLVLSKDAMVHIADKRALYGEVLRVLKPGAAFVAADWLWSEVAGASPVVQAWLSDGPLKFEFTTPEAARRALVEAGFEDVAMHDRSHILRQANRQEVEFLASPAAARLMQVAGPELARQRLASARGRQGALDSGDLRPHHFRGRKPAAR